MRTEVQTVGRVLRKAWRVLRDGGPVAFGRGLWGQLSRLYWTWRRSGLYESLAAAQRRREGLLWWRRRHRELQPLGQRQANNRWGRARRRLYAFTGPIPCPRRDVRRLRSLHDRYRTERIFIVGCGPSVNQTPMEKLAGEFTFSMNRIYLLFDRINWRPTFMTVVDWDVGPDIAADLNALDGITFFFPQRFRGLLRDGGRVHWYWMADRFPNDGRSVEDRFSYDITRGIVPCWSVTSVAVQIAFYLGFDPIYLVGVDADYEPSHALKRAGPGRGGRPGRPYLAAPGGGRADHFDARYVIEGARWPYPDLARQIEGYGNCRGAIEAAGGHIYNATVGGKLEVFERVDFDSLF
jgi:hypothetical protein